MGNAVRLFLGGDVMLGRGVDQTLPHPEDPGLREEYVRDARQYARAAGALEDPAGDADGFRRPWGDGLPEVRGADVVLFNLETSVTSSDEFASDKALHYRMHPRNVPAVTESGVDACSLANNHVLDFGTQGLADTFDSLRAAGLPWAGAGRCEDEARRPAVVPLAGGGRVLLFAAGAVSSGIPRHWAANGGRPGVHLLESLGEEEASGILDAVRAVKGPRDIAVVSVHWGGNWEPEVHEEEVLFAHHLIDGGVDVVHGHSAHHPRAIEMYRGRLVLYGCGDLINDYEGIPGYERFRDDLRLLHVAELGPADGRLVRLRMVPVQSRQLRLRHASKEDVEWLRSTLVHASRPFRTEVVFGADSALVAGS